MTSADDGSRREWPLVDDIIEAREHVVERQVESQQELPCLFDPKAFEGAQGELKVDDYALDPTTLEQWASRATAIRASLKAYGSSLQEDVDVTDSVGQRQQT